MKRIYVNTEVDLSDYEDEIAEYALSHMGMIYKDNLNEVDTDSLMDELESRGFDLGEYSRTKSVVEEMIMNKIMSNLDVIPLSEFDALIEKYNL